MAERCGLGILGAGAVAQDYLHVLRGLESFEVRAVVDPDAGARDAAARATGARGYAELTEAVDAESLDAALVLTPPASHEGLVVELLQRGVHVLCEKPIATSSAAAQRMFGVASRAGAVLMMASKFRYVADLIEARDLVAEGRIGDVVLLDNAFCARVDMTSRWNADAAVSGGGVLIDNGCHSFEIARFLLGPLVRVWAHFGRRTLPIKVEDTVRLMVESAGAALGQIDLSWSLDKASEHYVALQGTAGTIQVGWRGGRWRRAGDAGWTAFGRGYDKREAFASQLRNFLEVVRGDAPPAVTEQDAVASMRAVEAAYRSARVGRWVPLLRYDGAL